MEHFIFRLMYIYLCLNLDYGGRSETMYRYVDAHCLLPLYMHPKTHTHARTRTNKDNYKPL